MIIGTTEDGEVIETADGAHESSFRDLLRFRPDLRLDLLKRGKLEPNPEKRKRAIAEAEKEIRENRIKRIRAILTGKYN